jgi:hypothetical protein
VSLTRRSLLLAVPALAGAADALAAARGDREIVSAAIHLEWRAADIYGAAASDSSAPPALRRLAAHLHDQEEDHAVGLVHALRGLGGRPPARPEPQHRGPRGRAFGPFAIELENRLVAAYYEAMPRLRPGLRQPLGSIMASEGQHLVVLREALGRDPLPQAFEKGGRSR